MKTIIYSLTLLIFFACSNIEERPANHSDRFELIPEPDKEEREAYEKALEQKRLDSLNRSCESITFLKLKEESVQKDFFHELDAMLKKQYPNTNQEKEIFVDLTPKLLSQFLNDIRKEALVQNNQFEKEYHFKIAPPDFTDPEKCKDKILVLFDPESCRFRLEVFNTFLVEPDWCTESMVIYEFEIIKNKISDFWRTAAG